MSEDKYDAEETLERAFLEKIVEKNKFLVVIEVRMNGKVIFIQLSKEARENIIGLSEFLGERVIRAINTLELEVMKESLNTSQTKG